MIFDGDDTLWVAEALYDAALDRAEAAVDDAGLPGDQWRLAQRAADLRNVRKMGMSRDRFPLSSQQALDEVAERYGTVPSEKLAGEVLQASRSVFDMRAELVEGAENTLRALAPHFRLALLTKGDVTVQRKRVADSGFGPLFEEVVIVDDKDESSFRDLAARFGVAPGDCWSVGNSLASDINPALRVGMHAIWIDAHVWEHERRESSPADDRLVVLEDLRQVVGVLVPPVPSREGR